VKDEFITIGVGAVSADNILISTRDFKVTRVLTTSVENLGQSPFEVARIGGSGTEFNLEAEPIPFDNSLLGSRPTFYALTCEQLRTDNEQQFKLPRSFVVNAPRFISGLGSLNASEVDCTKEVRACISAYFPLQNLSCSLFSLEFLHVFE
jgi:hypothetical protein